MTGEHRKQKNSSQKSNYEWSNQLKRKKRATSDSVTPEKEKDADDKRHRVTSSPLPVSTPPETCPELSVALNITNTDNMLTTTGTTNQTMSMTSTTNAVTYTSAVYSSPIATPAETGKRTPGSSFMYHLENLKENRKAELTSEESDQSDAMDDVSDCDDADTVTKGELRTYMEKSLRKMKKKLASNMHDEMTRLFADESRAYRDEISRLHNKVKTLEEQVDDLWENNEIIANEISVCKDSLEEHEMYSRRNAIRIHGISEEANEDCVKKTKDFLEKELNVKLEDQDVCRGHRAGEKVSNSKTPRPILIKLVRHDKKVEILRNRDKLKNKRFVIREDVTKKRQTVMMDILAFASKELDLSGKDLRAKLAIWSTDGRITVKIRQKFYNIDSKNKIDLVKREILKLK